jgi:hypothetical protein
MRAASGLSLSIVRVHLRNPHAYALVQTARHSIAPRTLGFPTRNDTKIKSIEVVHTYVYRALVVTLNLGWEPAQGRSRYSWVRAASCRKCPPRLLQKRRCELRTVDTAAFARLQSPMTVSITVASPSARCRGRRDHTLRFVSLGVEMPPI